MLGDRQTAKRQSEPLRSRSREIEIRRYIGFSLDRPAIWDARIPRYAKICMLYSGNSKQIFKTDDYKPFYRKNIVNIVNFASRDKITLILKRLA